MLTHSASRRGGGLFSAISAMATALVDQRVRVDVFSGEEEISDEDAKAWGGASLRLGTIRGPRSFGYHPRLIKTLRQSAPDVIHTHGLWTYSSVASLQTNRLKCSKIISPHGMLDPWALKHSRWKKIVARNLFEDANLARAHCIHALCESELHSIRALGITGPVATIPNGVDLYIPELSRPPAWKMKIPSGAKTLLFLGRIHPKKGLSNLIKALKLTRDNKRFQEWHLVIAGWDDGGHLAALQELVDSYALSECVHFVGPQFGDYKSATLFSADAFILPSFSEGLPMAVLEAWAFSKPVLMTDACNLPEGFAFGAAANLDTDPHIMAQQLCAFGERTDADIIEMGRCGRSLVEATFSWQTVAEKMVRLYEWSLAGGPAPEFVSFA